jgi:hypothetical protein
VGNKQAAATLTKLPITATETGKQLRLSVPKSTPAGLVTVELMNAGKAFHEAQLIRLAQGHTPEDAMKVIAAEGSPSPGSTSGTSPTPPGSTAVQNRSPSSISARGASTPCSTSSAIARGDPARSAGDGRRNHGALTVVLRECGEVSTSYPTSNSRAEQVGQKNANVGSRSISGSSVRHARQPLADGPLSDPHWAQRNRSTVGA